MTGVLLRTHTKKKERKMAGKTGIGWTDKTFNPWWGCTEVSPACDNCYAKTIA